MRAFSLPMFSVILCKYDIIATQDFSFYTETKGPFFDPLQNCNFCRNLPLIVSVCFS